MRDEVRGASAGAGYGTYDNRITHFQVEGLKFVLDQMAEECSCNVLYYTLFADTVVDNGTVVGAVVQNKTGRQVIRARRVIDCTGDGDVAAAAGVPYEQGDEDTGLCQPVTLMFTIGGVDWEKACEFKKTDNRLENVLKKAQDAGDMRPFQSQNMGWWHNATRPGYVGINFTHINYIDSTKAEDLTAATIEGRKQAFETIDVYRKYIPGMENCYMVSTPNTIGLRESRRITGDYVLTRDDVRTQASFDDTIGYNTFFIDIHNTDGPGMDPKSWYPDAGFKHDLPYRILLPKGVENLTVAGRCASCDHEAQGSLRVMPQCGIMGQAAGTASALSLRENTTPRALDVSELQDELRSQDCILVEEDVEAANCVPA
ncbi:FAD-dependent oxidoreductase [Planctomycetota bacterium]